MVRFHASRRCVRIGHVLLFKKKEKRRVIESETLNSLKIVMHAVFVVSDRLLNNPNIDSIHIKTSFSVTFLEENEM